METQLNRDLIAHSGLEILSHVEKVKILKECNRQQINLLPFDFVSFINLPIFEDLKDPKIDFISTKRLIQNNKLRYFMNVEVFQGMKRVELIKDTQ